MLRPEHQDRYDALLGERLDLIATLGGQVVGSARSGVDSTNGSERALQDAGQTAVAWLSDPGFGY